MWIGMPGHSSAKRGMNCTKSTWPSPIAVHLTRQPAGISVMTPSRRLVVTMYGASVSRASTGFSSVQSELPES